MTDIFFMMGPTNSGKTTLADQVIQKYPGSTGVFVGRKLRAKYGESFFKGQAAPKHTEQEALDLMDEGIEEGLQNNSPIIMVDGQPRSDDQVTYVIENYFQNPTMGIRSSVWFLLLHCDDHTRMERLNSRDVTPEKRELALARFQGDMPQIYKAVYSIVLYGLAERILTLASIHDSVRNFDYLYDYVNQTRM